MIDGPRVNLKIRRIRSLFEVIFIYITKRFEIWHVVNYGLAPYFKKILEKRLAESNSFFVASYDESFNGIIQKFEMYLLVWYQDKKDKDVKVKSWYVTFLGIVTGRDIKIYGSNSKIHSNFNHWPKSKFEVPELANSNREENQLFQLTDIESCHLHNVLGAFKTEVDKLDWTKITSQLLANLSWITC